MRAIGLMSGTSMDGVDVALLDTDGERAIRLGPQAFAPYDEADRGLLRAAMRDAVGLDDRDARPGALGPAEAMVTACHARAVKAFLVEHGLAREEIDVVGFHGQTVLHAPERGVTIQVGDGAALARRLGVRVAFDFRAADVAGGGQGAPLVPVYHRALVERALLEPALVERDAIAGPVAVINVGGVANVTLVEAGRDPIACDTGPGNALLDDLVRERLGIPFDQDGALAARGRVDEPALARLLAHPYFARPAPKSLDRDAFSRAAVEGLGTEDAAATLTAFTAATIAAALRLMPTMPRRAVICGGGGRNMTLMRELAARLPCPVKTADALGWSVEAMEAQAFAYLAVRRLHGLPITFPSTTGIAAPLAGGRLADP